MYKNSVQTTSYSREVARTRAWKINRVIISLWNMIFL